MRLKEEKVQVTGKYSEYSKNSTELPQQQQKHKYNVQKRYHE